MGIVTNEVHGILLGSAAFSSRQRLGEMLANKETMSTQLTDPFPSVRVGVQVCLKDNKPAVQVLSKILSLWEG